MGARVWMLVPTQGSRPPREDRSAREGALASAALIWRHPGDHAPHSGTLEDAFQKEEKIRPNEVSLQASDVMRWMVSGKRDKWTHWWLRSRDAGGRGGRLGQAPKAQLQPEPPPGPRLEQVHSATPPFLGASGLQTDPMRVQQGIQNQHNCRKSFLKQKPNAGTRGLEGSRVKG